MKKIKKQYKLLYVNLINIRNNTVVELIEESRRSIFNEPIDLIFDTEEEINQYLLDNSDEYQYGKYTILTILTIENEK